MWNLGVPAAFLFDNVLFWFQTCFPYNCVFFNPSYFLYTEPMILELWLGYTIIYHLRY